MYIQNCIRRFVVLVGLLVVMGIIFGQPAHSGGVFGDIVNLVAPGMGTKLDDVHRDLKDRLPLYGDAMDGINHLSREMRAETLGRVLKEMIIASRDNAIRAGTSSTPPHLFQELRVYFPDSLLKRVRYRVGQGHELSLQANAFRFGEASAIALDYVIVFRYSRDALGDLALWAHELGHVQQYERWGIGAFAKRYIRNRREVEKEADIVAAEFRRFASVHEDWRRAVLSKEGENEVTVTLWRTRDNPLPSSNYDLIWYVQKNPPQYGAWEYVDNNVSGRIHTLEVDKDSKRWRDGARITCYVTLSDGSFEGVRLRSDFYRFYRDEIGWEVVYDAPRYPDGSR